MNPRKRFQDKNGFEIRSASNPNIILLDGRSLPFGECQTMLEIVRDSEKIVAKKDKQLMDERQAKATEVKKVNALTSKIITMNSVILKLERCIEKSQERIEIALANVEEGQNVTKGYLDMVSDAAHFIDKGMDVAMEWKNSVEWRDVETLFYDETCEEESLFEYENADHFEEEENGDVDTISFGVSVCVIS